MRTVTPTSFYIGEDDTDTITATLLEGSVSENLSGATVYLTLKNDLETVRHYIACENGGATGIVSASLSGEYSATPGLYFGEFLVDFPELQNDYYFGSFSSSSFFGGFFGEPGGIGSAGQKTYPANEYITVKIKKAL